MLYIKATFVVQVLVNEGNADLNAKSSEYDGATALHLAAGGIVQYLTGCMLILN
jgi:hypothetical protein